MRSPLGRTIAAREMYPMPQSHAPVGSVTRVPADERGNRAVWGNFVGRRIELQSPRVVDDRVMDDREGGW